MNIFINFHEANVNVFLMFFYYIIYVIKNITNI